MWESKLLSKIITHTCQKHDIKTQIIFLVNIVVSELHVYSTEAFERTNFFL